MAAPPECRAAILRRPLSLGKVALTITAMLYEIADPT
jgi:hypothetical protein